LRGVRYPRTSSLVPPRRRGRRARRREPRFQGFTPPADNTGALPRDSQSARNGGPRTRERRGARRSPGSGDEPAMRFSSLRVTAALQAALRCTARSGATGTVGTRARAAARGVPNGAAVAAAVPSRVSTRHAYAAVVCVEPGGPALIPFVDFIPTPALMVATA
jgi:hypothetical protein